MATKGIRPDDNILPKLTTNLLLNLNLSLALSLITMTIIANTIITNLKQRQKLQLIPPYLLQKYTIK